MTNVREAECKELEENVELLDDMDENNAKINSSDLEEQQQRKEVVNARFHLSKWTCDERAS